MKSDDEKYVKIIINSNKQTGKLSAVNKDTVVMDGTKYYLSKLYDTALQPKLSSGETGTLYLDIDGEAGGIYIRVRRSISIRIFNERMD